MVQEHTRTEARLQAFRLIEAVQTEDPPAPGEVDARLTAAQDSGWPEVCSLLLYALAVEASLAGDAATGPAAERMLEQCLAAGEPALAATALAFHGAYLLAVDRIDESDDAVARAVTLLDGVEGPALELVTAYVQCGLTYQRRRLWELSAEMLARAGAALPECEERLLDSVVLHNDAEIQLEWASSLRELGDGAAAREHGARGLEVTRELLTVPMPPLWRDCVLALGLLLGALSGTGRHWSDEQRAELLERLEAGPEPYFTGFVALSVALPALEQGRLEDAAREASAAVAPLTGGNAAAGRLLALRVVAEAQTARGSDGGGAALAYGEQLARLRWHDRLTLLGSARARLRAERMRVDRDALVRDALLDELTGLPNRRGYAKYMAGRRELDADEPLAMLSVDLDRFKIVNDVHGHLIGDEVLRRIGRVLAANVRISDLAVRVGGDEFLVVLEGASEQIARARAERIAATVRAEPWDELAHGLRVTVSVGVAVGARGGADLLALAVDQALYRAKAKGGDRAAD